MGGTIILIIILVILVILARVGMSAYNGFVKSRNVIQESWRQVDVELNRRYELIPNLVETVRAYAAHERNTLEDITRLRSQAQQLSQSEGALPSQQRADVEVFQRDPAEVAQDALMQAEAPGLHGRFGAGRFVSGGLEGHASLNWFGRRPFRSPASRLTSSSTARSLLARRRCGRDAPRGHGSVPGARWPRSRWPQCTVPYTTTASCR